ncbi:MAG: DnaD domain protein [Bacteroides sp.]|nr:DnaD domain protein [Bacteroides sp.]
MNYKINLGVWNNIFCVPNIIVDRYIRLAGERELKVLLYLLRHSGEAFNDETIAKELSLSAEQVEEGIEFWKARGLFTADGAGELVPLQTAENTGAAASSALAAKTESIVKRIELTRAPDFPPAEIAKTVRGSDKADYLFKHCEALYGRPLKHNEQNTLMIILEDVCLPVEVALILVDHCFSVKKNTPSYMRSVALEWAESGINTIERAEKRAEELKRFDSAVGRFKSMFEVSSAFSKEQKELINRWVNDFGFEDEMISEAYQITLNQTGKLAFKYMNKILSDWYGKGIKKKEQLEADKKPKTAEKGENASLNIAEIERLMIERATKRDNNI